MEMATAHQPLLSTAHLQALGTDPMLYQSRCSAWQPAVASLPPVTEIPKESIIANTDFTTTSVIAKRRLSSKKRRKLNPEASSGDGSSSETTTRSPLSSSTASPSNASNTCTPFSAERSDMDGVASRDLVGLTVTSLSSQLPSDALNLSNAASAAVLSSSSLSSQQLSTVTTCAVPSSHIGVIQSQHIPNASLLSQYQQGVDYRYLQDQALLQQQAAAVQLATAVATSSEGMHHQPLLVSSQASSHGSLSSEFRVHSRSGFKWCKAHVFIAKQIQQHKQETQSGSCTQARQTTSPSSSVQASQPSHTSTMAPPSHLYTPPQQQHQHSACNTTSTPHLALMQYNLPANTVMATTATAPTTAYPPGYVAVPYSSVQELQMRMQQQQQQQQQQSLVPIPATQLQLSSGLPVMKPVMALTDNVVGLNLGLHMIGGLHPTLQHAQLAGLATAPPLAAPNSTAAVIHGQGPWGVAPVQGVNNSVFNHSFQPGVMAAPWVK